MLRSGANLIASARRSGATSETVTLRRGAVAVPVRASVSAKPTAVAAGPGSRVYVECHDVIVNVEDYDLGGGPTKPAAGDRFELTDGIVYQAAATMGEDVWSIDPQRTWYCVRVRRIS